MKLTVIDLFCGLGGFSQAFRDRGHRVIGVDIVPPADVIADVRAMPFKGEILPDLVLAAPPCQEFTRSAHPWMVKPGQRPPDLEKGRELVSAALAAIESLSPRWWMFENVQGCAKFASDLLGRPFMHIGSRYLWGRFPIFLVSPGPSLSKWRKFTMDRHDDARPKRRQDLDSWTAAGSDLARRLGLPANAIGRARARSLIPYPISEALCLACERAGGGRV